jgi:hypothetical protein
LRHSSCNQEWLQQGWGHALWWRESRILSLPQWCGCCRCTYIYINERSITCIWVRIYLSRLSLCPFFTLVLLLTLPLLYSLRFYLSFRFTITSGVLQRSMWILLWMKRLTFGRWETTL